MTRLKIVEPPAAMIDWQAFGDCVIATRWGRPIELKRELGLSNAITDKVWHGRPVGLLPFLRVCKAMKISPLSFLVER